MKGQYGYGYLNGKLDRFVNLPKMESSDLKTLYNEFSAGKKPVDVIANFGYHPEIVESEYGRFLRLSGSDIDALLKHIIADCGRIWNQAANLSASLISTIKRAIFRTRIFTSFYH